MGVNTDAEVCNLALVNIGHSQFIDDLNEDSTEAKVAKAVFAHARDACLERFMWKFATLRAVLADLGAAAVRDGWDFAYELPGDCIAARYLVQPGVRAPDAASRVTYDIEADTTGGRGHVTGKVLLTDQEEAELVYTARVEAPALWSPLFAEALAWQLSSRFALGIQKKPAVALEMAKQYELALAAAAASQLRQVREDQPPASEYITVRR